MALQDVFNGLCRVDTQEFAEVWIQWKVNLSFVEEVEHLCVLHFKDNIEGVFVIVHLLVEQEE